MRILNLPFLAVLLLTTSTSFAQKEKNKDTAPAKPAAALSGTYGALAFRNIGPAVTSGRISDFAVNPANSAEYYVASSSGGVWRTRNAGTTYEPIFDDQGSYSIGCVALDPSNPNVVWVGSGENNNQRSVAYGDGVYKSTDGGKSWKNMGLKNSEHIANVVVDPTDPNTVYVAAYGPVWSDGGERGVYKSTDGGQNWTLVKQVGQYAGCNNLVMDPRNPKVLYAAFHQRQRKVFTYIGGGPESGLYKTTDGGATWNKVEGLPGGDVGRIGIDVSPANPDFVYAVVEAPSGSGGVYRSTNRGASWEKMSGTSTSGNYYQELTCDPKNPERIFITDTYYKVSYDGGRTVRNLGEINKHIDNHCIWIDPANTNHLRVGCDGGIYETWDNAKSWEYKHNMPVVQFYKVATDNGLPFYHVHGGTQDNLSLGGPSRTTSGNGIPNSDWYITSTGDGFESQVDPTDPNIVYAQSQYGGLQRFDRKSGQGVFIQAQAGENEPALRWNWDAPLVISEHSNTRIYHGANVVFRSDDRGNTWRAISKDLSRGIDRNKLEVMGKVWSVDAIAKNGSTDIYGQTTSIAESTLDQNLLWVGTDDGLVHATRDGGATWEQFDNLPGVPERSYVHQVIASRFDKNTAYVCFNHHRYGDFKPYLLKTTDGGKKWTSIAATLPERGSVYTIAEDHVDRNLLFCGTEFGAFFTRDGGQNWIALKAGLPTVAVRDMDIQRRENDLVLATFGRGFYVLDDYSALRSINDAALDAPAAIFPVKDALLFVPNLPLGLRDKGHMGSSYYAAENPPVGAVFTYWLKDDIKTLKAKRKAAEKEKADKKEPISYPTAEELRAEDNQPEPFVLFTITDEKGSVVRHIKTGASKGLKRLVWDFRYNTPAPVQGRYKPAPDQLFGGEELGHLAIPGKYFVQMSKFEDGEMTALTEPTAFMVKALDNNSLPAKDQQAYLAFCKKVSDLRREVSIVNGYYGELNDKLSQIKSALDDIAVPPAGMHKKVQELRQQMEGLNLALFGDGSLARREFETKSSINDRIGRVQGGMWNITSDPTTTFRTDVEIAERQLKPVVDGLKSVGAELNVIEQVLGKNGAPYTPGRKPN
jgi:photosystem II stability/assembly factor-like uncharacterized protein